MTDLDLDAVRDRVDKAHRWADWQSLAVPAAVRLHFTDDVPALISYIQHLTTELAATRQMLDVLTREETR
ncbi:hypothetical protein ACWT_5684 [Actinoplanes sp. SE50]|uniref:hypothetical protein n=1 Tax=unclassified Actinoplanes TaxID=2626549 RepID=UPI00023ED2D3|nr:MULTISPECIES: hypothetical protein [unclassified Actinoplanes]AEV86701.1 hypothetical protein ACPL_5814 [Actinoplanes sp. SE50/110]ATO85099.1 hypothetical protein ACWT_5684 [Actinoplanes sp. SE50]SLM02510.1 hypothetical protein ACSP50_5760 [Actinoplanes sp. SE50/110]